MGEIEKAKNNEGPLWGLGALHGSSPQMPPYHDEPSGARIRPKLLSEAFAMLGYQRSASPGKCRLGHPSDPCDDP